MTERFLLSLRATTPALLGGVSEAPSGVQAAAASVDREGSPSALLPGSSLRGVLRHDIRRFVEARTGVLCTLASEGDSRCQCATCVLFGAPNSPGKIAVRSSVAATGSRWVTTSHVSLNRATRTAADDRLWAEQRVAADFIVIMEALRPLETTERELIEQLLAWEQATGLRLGRSKSAGGGWFEVAGIEHAPVRATGLGSARLPASDARTRRRYALVLEAEEPLRIAGRRQRTFYREGLDSVPVSTLRGAIGWSLARAGLDDAAADLFVDRPVRLTAARSGDARSALGPIWIGHARCRGPQHHEVDTSPAIIAAALGVSLPTQGCPLCGAFLKPVRPEPLPALVTGHTEIEPGSNRVREGRLFYQVTVQPGTRLVAELEAYPDQAARIGELGDVLVGGNRTRGLGRARLGLEELPELAPIEQRLRTTRSALTDLGSDEEIAVLGVLADAAPPLPLREALRERGCEVVAAAARGAIRGGWDEKSGSMRPLQRLVAAGSWVAVRAPRLVDVVASVEEEGLADPIGVNPTWLRVRSDVGGSLP